MSPEKAMTAEELGLPVEFKDRMKRRLCQLGVFVEIKGKYYLSEERLKEVKTSSLREEKPGIGKAAV